MKPVSGVLPKVALVASHASLQMGGEASLAVHHFRGLLARQVPVYLLCHARARQELQQLFPEAQHRILYAPDSWLQRLLWRLGQRLPLRVQAASTAVVMQWLTQRWQVQQVKALVQAQQINLVHQPMPVSPREPSCLTGLGVPVVLGPMNGNMDYPPGLAHREPAWVRAWVVCGRQLSALANRWCAGKLRADLLLVANARTRNALPPQARGRVVEMVENGVDLGQWPPRAWPAVAPGQPVAVRFCFVGRLVAWKAVDLLLRAFALARSQSDCPMQLDIVGSGPQALRLRQLASDLCLTTAQPQAPLGVIFHGWQSQAGCAQILTTSDALVLPSLLECGGAVVLEAMASAVPVIAAHWGGPADYLDASCGMLVPVTNEATLIAGLADAMLRLAGDFDLRRSLGQAGRCKVEAEHAWHIKTERMLGLYQSVLKS